MSTTQQVLVVDRLFVRDTLYMGGKEIKGLQAGDEATEAVNKAQLDSASGDVLVKRSAADTTAAYLDTKLVAGSGITLNVQNPGANESIEIVAAGGDSIVSGDTNTSVTTEATADVIEFTAGSTLSTKINAFGLGVRDGTADINRPVYVQDSLSGYLAIEVNNTAASTNSFSALRAVNDNGKLLNLAVGSSGYTGTLFGSAWADKAIISTGDAELNIAAGGTNDVVIGTNDTAAITIDGTTQAISFNTGTAVVNASGQFSNPDGQVQSEAFGNLANAGLNYCTAVGYNAQTVSNHDTAIGSGASAGPGSATAVGRVATAAQGAVAVGYYATATTYSIALGRSANANAGGIALGYIAVTTAADQFVAKATDWYLNQVANATPSNGVINATGGSGTDIAGANLTLAGGISTGAGAAGLVKVDIAAPSGSSSTPNTLATVATFNEYGLGIGAVTASSNYAIDVDNSSIRADGNIAVTGSSDRRFGGTSVAMNVSLFPDVAGSGLYVPNIGVRGASYAGGQRWFFDGATLLSDAAPGTCVAEGVTAYASASTNQDGGAIAIYGGNSATAAGDGGDVRVYGGTGTDADGSVRLAWNGSAAKGKIGFFDATPVAQSSNIGALTDSSGGTADGTVAAVSGSGADSDINNNFAELVAKVNLLEQLVEDFGLTA